MEAEAATLKSLFLAGELAEPAKSHPEYKNSEPEIWLSRRSQCTRPEILFQGCQKVKAGLNFFPAAESLRP